MISQVRPLTADEIRSFLSWEYDPPFNIYNINSINEADDVAFFMDPANGYFAIVDEQNEMIGFCNFGEDARVPDGSYDDEAVDIGMGVRPDLTGQGQGHHFAGVVFEYAKTQFPNQKQRATIAKFNKRAQNLCAKFGFSIRSEFQRESDGRPFVIMVRENGA